MGWSGQPVVVEELLFKPKHGLVDQSLHSRMGVETTNGDGFGLGWYGQGDGPGVYHGVAPAWGDANLRELASHIESPMFLAHVRATTGTAIQRPTAIRSATASGCSSTTAWSRASISCGAS
jgi:glutamine amidotransferase